MDTAKFSKEEVQCIKAVAVLLMVYHHLFGFPERIAPEYVMLLDFPFLHLGTILSYQGKICIALFAFCTGYGLTRKCANKQTLRGGYRSVLSSLLSFFLRYWVVFAVCIPYGLISGIYSFSWRVFLKSLFGFSSAYNAEWWYVQTYFLLLALFPLIDFLLSLMTEKSRLLLFSFFFALFACLAEQSPMQFINDGPITLCMLSGCLMARSSAVDRICMKFQKLHPLSLLSLGFFILTVVFLTRIILGNNAADYLLVPFLVFSLILIFRSGILFHPLRLVLLTIGKYATYIWLMHTFFAYYYFQDFLYSLKYSPVIFASCIGLCLAVGFWMEKACVFAERNILSKKL